MYNVAISAKAQKEIRALKKLFQDEVLAVLKELREDPFFGKELSRELQGRQSIRIDVYRIVYKVSEKDKTVYIISAGHRSTVYLR